MLFLSRMRLILLLVLPFFFLIVSTSIAQDAELQFFEGGKIDGTFMLRSTILTGSGIDAPTRGLIAPVKVDPFIVFGNPAALGKIPDTQFGLGFSPTIDFDVTQLADTKAPVVEEVDAAIATFRKTGPVTYPVVSGTIGRCGSPVTGFAVCFVLEGENDEWFAGIPRLLDRAAIGYNQPLTLHTDAIYSGLRVRLRTISEVEEDEILLYSTIKMGFNIDLTSDSWVLSGARQLNDFWFGIALSRTDVAIDLSGYERSDGLMSMSGLRSAFNDLGDDWENRYYGTADIMVSGASWAPRLGVLYSPGKHFMFGANARIQTGLDLEGNIDFSLFRFPALRLNAEGDEKQFDVNLIEDPSNLTLTYEKLYDTPNSMKAKIPSSFSIAASYLGPLKPSFTYTQYFGELSYQLRMLEDGQEFVYKRGIKPSWDILFSLDLSAFQMSFGATRLQDLVEGYKDASGTEIKQADAMIVPRASLGFYTVLEDNLTIGTLLYALPEDAVRFSLVYHFR